MADDNQTGAGTLEKPSDAGLGPSGVYKRWMTELRLSDKQEKDWRKDAQSAVEIYEAKKRRAHNFNILWANTETLRPALYNSLPIPDVRKRWDDENQASQAASVMLERALTYSLDAYGADSVFKLNALDAVLTGRAIARIRYLPAFTGTEGAEPTQQEAMEGEQVEELAYEQCVCEHVQWTDFRHGPGKTWDEVTWVGFRHRLTREQLVEKFGDIGEQIELDAASDDEVQKMDDAAVANVFKTAEVWEFWDKDRREVVFVAASRKEGPVLTLPDPLSLQGFFPVPEPLYAIERSDSLTPITPYSLYREQAEELNLISDRINKITRVLKFRGIYDSRLAEIGQLASAADGQLLPVSNAAMWDDKNGLESAIWMMPIEQAAKILTILEGQREACKQVIYELTGISDIVRGSSNAQETATAQQIKAQFGTLRLQRFQREVQRYIRDMIRLMAEVIAEKFQPQTLLLMSGLDLPSQQQVAMQAQAAVAQWQMVAAQAQRAGQPVPPQPQLPPVVTIEDVLEVLRSDMLRSYRIDIETDSTIQALESADQKAAAELIQGLGTMAQALIPVVQGGLLPQEAVQAIVKAIIKKFKLGRAVEDAIEQPAQPMGPSPEMQQAQQQIQQAQQQVQQQAQEVQQQGQQVQQEGQSVQMDRMKLENDKQVAQLQLENQRMKLDHAAEIHRIATQQAGSEVLNKVSQMLADHEHKLRSMFVPAVTGEGNA